MQASLFDKSDSTSVQQLIASEDGSDVKIWPQFIALAQADKWLLELTHHILWQQRAITVYGKRHLQPRLIAWYGDEGIRYRYSGDTLLALPWTQPLGALRTLCEQQSDVAFNSVLLNRYRDGQDAMGWHSDNESELGSSPVIASVSLGQVRRFDLRHRQTREKRSVFLPHGSLLVMAGNTQVHWEHQIPRSKKITGERINLTFRRVEPSAS